MLVVVVVRRVLSMVVALVMSTSIVLPSLLGVSSVLARPHPGSLHVLSYQLVDEVVHLVLSPILRI